MEHDARHLSARMKDMQLWIMCSFCINPFSVRFILPTMHKMSGVCAREHSSSVCRTNKESNCVCAMWGFHSDESHLHNLQDPTSAMFAKYTIHHAKIAWPCAYWEQSLCKKTPASAVLQRMFKSVVEQQQQTIYAHSMRMNVGISNDNQQYG